MLDQVLATCDEEDLRLILLRLLGFVDMTIVSSPQARRIRESIRLAVARMEFTREARDEITDLIGGPADDPGSA